MRLCLIRDGIRRRRHYDNALSKTNHPPERFCSEHSSRKVSAPACASFFRLSFSNLRESQLSIAVRWGHIALWRRTAIEVQPI